MKLLLDTHVLLWFAAGDEQLGKKARAAIADPANSVLVSAVSFWEAAIKARVGKLEVDVPSLIEGAVRAGFDQLLLAQAAAEEAIFVTDDGHAKRYGVPIMRSR